MPAIDALLFACHREHQSRRVETVDIGDLRHLHSKEAAQAHAVAFGNRATEHEVRLFGADFTRKLHFFLGDVKHRTGNAERVITVEAHLFLDLVLRFDAIGNLERHALFLELGKHFQAFRTCGEREVFGTGLFGLELDLGQVFASHAHIFEQAGAFGHQGVHAFLAELILFIEEFTFLVERFAILPAGGNSHIALAAGFFEISLGAVEFCTLLDSIDSRVLLSKCCSRRERHETRGKYKCGKITEAH